MLDAVLSTLQLGSSIELTAMLLALLYLILAIKENRACWYAAFASTALYTYVFWDVSLLMESLLNVYYMLMAIYGWWHWQAADGQTLSVQRWALKQHLLAIVTVLMLSAGSGWLLQTYTGAAMPFVDSFTTWASVITTFMVASKILENWLYWIVIDSVSIFLYIDRDLYLTAALFVLYVLLACVGYRQWKQHDQSFAQLA